MSEIRTMNKEIRWRAAIGAVIFAIAAAVAIAPRPWVDLVLDGDVRSGLSWNALIAPFLLVTLLLEAFEVGRHPKHRALVNDQIVRDVVSAICSSPHCPRATEPNDSIRQAAMAIFYREIDQPSREVAFYQWGWYYTARLWLALAVIALVVAFVLSWFVSTDEPAIRWSAVTALVGAALMSFGIANLWKVKTLNHARSQVTQILPRLGTTLEGATCAEPNCPST